MAGDTVDAVVIGSGAGGGTAAWALAERGLSVVLLEAGPRYDPADDFATMRDDWERTGFPAKVSIAGRQTMAPLEELSEPGPVALQSWRRVGGRYNPGTRRVSWGYQHAVGLGGSTLRFTGEAQRLHPQAMALRSRFGVGADWPLDYADLEPYYVAAERAYGVAGPDDDTVRWRSAPLPLPPHPFSYASQKLAEGSRQLGLAFVPNYRAALSLPYQGRPACNYCGQCNRGCPIGDKGSADVTVIRAAEATRRCEIRTGVQVVEIAAGPGDRVEAVRYADASGALHSVKGRAVVVACGAVETPRLLLASTGLHAPDGLGNESGLVGRHFMETLFWVSSALHQEALGSYRGLPADGIIWDYNAPDAIPGAIGGCRFSSGVQEADLSGPVAYAHRVAGSWGQSHRRAMRESFGRALSVVGIAECLPDPGAFIDLDPTERDGFGMPRARIHARLDSGARARLSFMAATARDLLAASGAADLVEEYGAWDIFSPTHVFGTCRMGDDPASSVVDRWGRSHRWRNLFVADASVFPSSGGGEGPMLTIAALAIRTAGKIADAAVRFEL